MHARGADAAASPPGTVALWAFVLGPPVVWTLRFLLNYGLMPIACTAGSASLLHGFNAAGLVVTVALGWRSARAWSAARTAPERSDDEPVRRVRFMALFGMMSAALFALVILAEAIAVFMVDPCLTSGPLTPH